MMPRLVPRHGPKPRMTTFAELYDEHVDDVYRYIHRRCRDHVLAEDVTQDTFMAAIRSTDDPSTINFGWLVTVARNRLFDLLRRQISYEEKLRLVAGGLDGVSDSDVAERLRIEDALDALPMHYRLVLTLHYLNGMTVAEIAGQLDKTHKSVEALITRARRELITELERTDDHANESGAS